MRNTESFNLVIKRLLISGENLLHAVIRFFFGFQSRYRAASHFRSPFAPARPSMPLRFNLVIERLLISG